MENCIFCKIIDGEIPSNKLYEDERCYVFRDAAPVAPDHVLVIPKIHTASIIDTSDTELLGHLMGVAREIAKKLELDKKGFRIVINTGDDGGQTVHHLHVHLIGGRSMAWPPG